MQPNSPCIRCGKIRITSKSWNEYINKSLVTYTLTVCPDAECQKIVDEQLKKRKEKIAAIQEESNKRKRDNIRNKKSIKI